MNLKDLKRMWKKNIALRKIIGFLLVLGGIGYSVVNIRTIYIGVIMVIIGLIFVPSRG